MTLSHLRITTKLGEGGRGEVYRGEGAVARVSWALVAETTESESIEVYFNGQELDADDPRAIQLPTFDPDQTHHIRVRLPTFVSSGASTARSISSRRIWNTS